MFLFMRPSLYTKMYREEEFLYCQDVKNSQQLRRFGNRLWSRVLKISYNIDKCLCLLRALLPVIGFGLKIL
jgi:hypothetical protein